MINKALRILIADPQHIQRLRLERDFNYQGYYAIAPVSRLDELQTLLEHGGRAFDLVLVNASLAAGSGFNLQAYCEGHPLIRHAVVYNVAERGLAVLSTEINSRTAVSAVQLPAGLKHRLHLQPKHQCIVDVLP